MLNNKIIFSLFLSLCAPVLFAELTTVAHVDLPRYLGTWQEIARFDNKHQEGCLETEAQYTQLKDFIEIKNTCTLADGKKKTVTGRAKVENHETHAQLKVNFTPFLIRMFGVGWGNYWIIDLGANYEFAVVSEPKMERLWILSRTKPMSKTVYDEVIARLKEKGFATEKLVVAKDGVSGT